MLTTTAIVFGVNILGSVLKSWVAPRFGKFGVQVSVFALALIGAVFMTYGESFAPLTAILKQGAVVFSGSVALYEVLLKRLDVFKTGTIAPS